MVIAVDAEFALIRWDKFNTSDERQLLSWIVNYREASVFFRSFPSTNQRLTTFSGKTLKSWGI